MAYSNLLSDGSSSIEKLEACLDDDNISLLDALERDGIFLGSASQHQEVGTNTSLPSSCSSSRCSRYSTTSDRSVSFSSRRSSYDTVSPISGDDDDDDQQYEIFECFDYADEEKKRPPSEVDEDEVDVDDDMVVMETCVDLENICAPSTSSYRNNERKKKKVMKRCYNESNQQHKNDEKEKRKREQEKNNRTTTTTETRRRTIKDFCSATCLLRYLGILLLANGLLLPFALWSVLRIVSRETAWLISNGPVPISLSCVMMTFCSVLAFITDCCHKRRQYKKRSLLVWFVLVLSVICTSFCVISLVYLISVIHSSLHQLNGCTFNEWDRICSCYGPNHKIFKFAENLGCNAVKDQLKNLAFGVSILFGVGCLLSTGITGCALFFLCRRKRRRAARKNRTRPQQTSTTVENASSMESEHQRVIDIFDDLDDEYDEDDGHGEESTFTKNNKLATKPPSTKPVVYTKKRQNKHSKKRLTKTTTTSTKITSVATQTPNFMVSTHLYDIIDPNTDGIGRRGGATSDTGDESGGDTYSELSSEFLSVNHPPPYDEAVKNKEQKFR